jgi:hypothetical protein
MKKRCRPRFRLLCNNTIAVHVHHPAEHVNRRMLMRMAPIALDYGIDGVFRRLEDGPSYIFFGACVHDAFEILEV